MGSGSVEMGSVAGGAAARAAVATDSTAGRGTAAAGGAGGAILDKDGAVEGLAVVAGGRGVAGRGTGMGISSSGWDGGAGSTATSIVAGGSSSRAARSSVSLALGDQGRPSNTPWAPKDAAKHSPPSQGLSLAIPALWPEGGGIGVGWVEDCRIIIEKL